MINKLGYNCIKTIVFQRNNQEHRGTGKEKQIEDKFVFRLSQDGGGQMYYTSERRLNQFCQHFFNIETFFGTFVILNQVFSKISYIILRIMLRIRF